MEVGENSSVSQGITSDERETSVNKSVMLMTMWLKALQQCRSRKQTLENHARQELQVNGGCGIDPFMETTGVTSAMGGFTFTDGFCGIGGGRCGMEQANGVCVGAFEKCEHAREVYERNRRNEVLSGWRGV